MNSVCTVTNDVWLVNPGQYPTLIGTFQYDTLEIVSFDLPSIIPEAAKTFDVVVAIINGGMRVDTQVGLWLWTDCGGPERPYVHFKRQAWYTQAAVGYDSETLSFVNCYNNRKLFVRADRVKSGAGWVELHLVSYTK